MKHFFLDTTALIYAYVPGCEPVLDLVARSRIDGGGPRVLVCDIAVPEVVRLLVDRHAKGHITKEGLDDALARLERDFQKTTSPFFVVESSGLLTHAHDWMQLFPITPQAAITVAASLAVRAYLPADSEICLVSYDEDQMDAAQAEGFEVCRPHLVG